MAFGDALKKKLEKLKENTGIRVKPKALAAMGGALLLFGLVFAFGAVSRAIIFAAYLAPVWLPVLLVGSAHHLWYIYKRSEAIANQKYVLLEIKPPRNLVKTPLAMEAFLSSLHLTGGESNWWAKLNGGTRPFWSLEIASIEGQVHFYIWGRAGFRRIVESQLYAQYPGVQVVEAVDYTRTITASPEEYSVWGCDYKHTADDPLPIKTYVEFGLDRTQKEPEQIDPLAQLVEFMGSLGSGEYMWLQYVIRAHKAEKYGKKNAKGKDYTWIDEGKRLVEEIRSATRDKFIDPVTKKESPGFPNPTKGQMEKIAAIERNISKLAFDVGARAIYIAKPEKFNGGSIAHIIALYKAFTSEGWNGINSTGWMKTFDDYPWERGMDAVKDKYRKALVQAYRRRQFFYDPFFEAGLSPKDVMVMSTEELATIFHIPSRAIETPGLTRIASATSDAPGNLPI